MDKKDNKTEFMEKAGLVSAFLYEIKTMEDAFLRAVALCKKKQLKTIAAPDLCSGDFTAFESLCRNNNIDLVKTGLRKYCKDIYLGFTIADFGIAETGTIVISSDNEDARLATMLSEFHVVLLPASKIRATALDMVEDLKKLTDRPFSYTAFITGASRTADIERVLAIGVHGPLELHIIILI